MKVLSVFVSVLTVLVSTVLAAPGACSGACWVHDPAVIRRTSDGTYFRFSTGNKIQIATASSISGPWTIRGSVVPNSSIINLPGRDDLWAPDVAKVGDVYYLYYSVSTFGSQNSAIGYATSTTMDAGSWTDHGSVGITSKPGSAYNAIDANLIALNGGGYRFTWGSFWGDLYSVAAKDPPKAITGGAVQVAYQPAGAHAIEGPSVYYRSGYYYLFFSAGVCCGFDANRPPTGQEYKILVCRSTNVAGGYVDRNGVDCRNGGGTLVLGSNGNTYGPGGQGVFADSGAGGTVLYYHYVDTRVGYADGDKKFGWNILNWSNGWPSV